MFNFKSYRHISRIHPYQSNRVILFPIFTKYPSLLPGFEKLKQGVIFKFPVIDQTVRSNDSTSVLIIIVIWAWLTHPCSNNPKDNILPHYLIVLITRQREVF